MSLLDSFQLDPQQLCAAATLDRDIVLDAGAGSGKTRTLVARYLNLLEHGLEPAQIVAVTFTAKAAREMRNRIRAAIRAHTREVAPAERERWSSIEADIDMAPIGTLHALCTDLLRSHPAEAGIDLLRSHPAEAGIDPQFQVLDEGVLAVWQTRAVADALSWAVDRPALTALFQGFSTELLAEILRVLFGRRLDLAALDTAGARELWKCAILTRLNAFAQQTDALGALGELRARTGRELVLEAGDKLAPQIVALCAQWDNFERHLAARDALAAAQALFKARRECMALNVGKKSSAPYAALRELRALYDASPAGWLGGTSAKDAAPDAGVEQLASECVEALLALFAEALRRYEAQKRQAAMLDFDDLEGMAAQLLRAEAIRRRWLAQYKSLLVDEFQDTNERQRQIVNALSGFRDGISGRLFIVGDAKQSIYRFRGADVAVFAALRADITARGGLALVLDRTYRAHRSLVVALNEVLAALMSAQDLSQPFAVAFSPLSADRAMPDPSIHAPFVEFLCGLGASSEEARPAAAQLLARRLHALHAEGVGWESVALLFRASSGFAVYEDALEQAGIPFMTVAGRGFYHRPEIRDLLNILRALANPWDDLAMAGLLRSPAFGLSDAALYELRWPEGKATPRAFAAALNADLSGLPAADRQQAERANRLLAQWAVQVDRVSVAELLKSVLDESSYLPALSTLGSRLLRNVEKLLADAHESGFVRVNEFLEYVETLNAAGAREGESPVEAQGAVRLMTVHRAKGLQFPVVVLADASRAAPNLSAPVLVSPELGLAPNLGRLKQEPLAYSLAKSVAKAMDSAENLRLLYVAATRAQEKLLVCGHQLQNRGEVWLQMLLESAGGNIDELVSATGQGRTMRLPGCAEQIGLLASPALDLPAAVALAAAAPSFPALADTLVAERAG